MVKSDNVLVAFRWVAQAWEKVKAQTISKSFKKAGILNTEMDDIVSCDMEEDDPFRDADEQLVGLINVMPQKSCSSQEYVNGEDTMSMERTPSQYAMVWMMQDGRKTFWDG